MDGWIKLHRKVVENDLWLSEPFTRGQAWVDLILLANHKDGFFYLRDHKIEVKRGQVGWSQLKLSKRWGWSRNKVRKFLKDLEKGQQLEQQQSRSTTIITIKNYEKYQKKGQQLEQQKDNRKTTERHKQESKERKETIIERKKKFEDFINETLNKKRQKYLSFNEDIKEFFEYWSEYGPKDKKMRFEKQTSFSCERRLDTWFKNKKRFNKNYLQTGNDQSSFDQDPGWNSKVN